MTKYLAFISLAITLSVFSKSVSGQITTATPAQPAKVELKFNESDKVTTANLKPTVLSGTDTNKVELEAFAFFRGRTPTEEPSPINISFHSGSSKEWFATNRELV